MAAIICTYCKTQVPEGADICPNCYHPVDFNAQPVEQPPVYQEPEPRPTVEESRSEGGFFGWFRRRTRKASTGKSGKTPSGQGGAFVPPSRIEPEGVTTMLSQTDIVDDEATGVLQVGSNVRLRRLATGEDYSLLLPVTIGRGSAADCHILGNKAIGRQHVRIAQSDSSYLITDLHSTNGTFLRDAQLQPNRPARIELGEKFRMANEEFVLGEG